MSNPKNPLDNFISYEARHILLAFDNTSTASKFVCPASGLGKVGTELKLKDIGCGRGFVVINELEDSSYKIRELVWSYDFFSPVTPSTTISAGNFIVADARGNQFPSFLRRVARKLNLPITRVTFYLVTVFRGRTIDNDITENYTTNPLIISVTDSATGFQDGMVNQFTFNFSFLYNTVAQLPNYSRLDQFTITNSENNPSKSVPTTHSGKAVILSRKDEDSNNNPQRQNRLKHTTPMRNLKDVFKGFESELQEMRFENKRQLQEFMAIVRPSTVKKIKTPKTKNKKDLEVNFKVVLDDAYSDYTVDNRNLMTEQTENQQTNAGITSLTVPPGSNIFSTVDALMKLSTKTGADVLKGYGFKTVMTTVTDCEGVIDNTIGIKRYKIPKNRQGVEDTGPDAKGNVHTLELSYMDGNSGLDVISLSFASSPSNDISVLEEDTDDIKDDALTASSQREQITFERGENSGFSGLRVASPPTNFGLQSAASGILTDTLKHRYALSQNTITIVNIVGNPDLYSDLARNPRDVGEVKSRNAKLYRFPEYYPMYINLKVKISNTYTYGINTSKGDEDYWYHTYHYHLSGVTNVISAGKFVQTLRLLSSDDAI